VTSNQELAPRRHQSPGSVRSHVFPRRLRGLDESQVYDYLEGLADQLSATDHAQHEMQEEIGRLQSENARLRSEVQRMRGELAEVEEAGGRVNDQVVDLFSQAQLVAEEMVEEYSRDARERLGQARAEERRILEEAMATAEQTRRDAEALIRWTAPGAINGGSYSGSDPLGLDPAPGPDAGSAAAAREPVRSYARAAQAQMKSLMDAFSSQVQQFGGTLPEAETDFPTNQRSDLAIEARSDWWVGNSRNGKSSFGPA
jgi:DivIVA domain-containing protein